CPPSDCSCPATASIILAAHDSFTFILPPPRPTLFPYTTLFRSCPVRCFRRSRWRGAPRFRAHAHRPNVSDAENVSSSKSRRTSRSEEHTSELQSRSDLVCRLLLEKKKNKPESPYPAPRSLLRN